MLFYNIVGYGDLYPKSTIGRIITVFAGVLGLILHTILIIGLQGLIRLEFHEKIAYDFVTRVNDKTGTKQLAADYFIAGYRYSKVKKKYYKAI